MKFWNWTNQTDNPEQKARTLFLNGTIADESWYDDDVTPQLFKDDLYADTGDVTVWLNSPGGDCIAASQIYNMLREYPGNITMKIDGIAASAASLIAMAGDKILMSPVSMMMIHNPLTAAIGNSKDMQKAIEMLDEVKESIINAYELKTGLSRSKLSHLMDNETWMNAAKAVELGFADGILYHDEKKDYEKIVEPEKENGDNKEPEKDDTDKEKESESEKEPEKADDKKSEETDNDKKSENPDEDERKKENIISKPMLFSQHSVNLDLISKINKHFETKTEETNTNNQPIKQGRSVNALMDRLNLLKY